jgi:hypothetical protein
MESMEEVKENLQLNPGVLEEKEKQLMLELMEKYDMGVHQPVA